MNVLVYLAMVTLCCGYALARGGVPERIGVAILIAAILGSALVPAASEPRFRGFEWGVAAVDAAMLLALVALALRAQRYWPMWMAAVLVATVVTHLLMLSPRLMPWSYSVAIAAWSYPNPLLLAAGAWRHRRRVRIYGDDPPWS